MFFLTSEASKIGKKNKNFSSTYTRTKCALKIPRQLVKWVLKYHGHHSKKRSFEKNAFKDMYTDNDNSYNENHT